MEIRTMISLLISIPFIFLIVFIYVLIRNKERIWKQTFFNRLVPGLIIAGVLLSATYELPPFLLGTEWHVISTSIRPIVLYLMPAIIATLLYGRFSELKDMEMIALIVWGSIAIFAGLFISFFMTMDNPALPYDGPENYTYYRWVLHLSLRNVGYFVLSTIVLSTIYFLHAREKNTMISVLIGLMIVAFPIIYAYILYYSRMLGLL